MSLSLLFAPAIAGPAQAAAGVFKLSVNPSGTPYYNEDVNLVADFPTGKYDEGKYGNYPYLSVFSSPDGDTFSRVAPGVKSDKAGKLTLSYNVGTADSWVKVCNDKTKPNGQAGTLFNDTDKEFCTSVVKFSPVEPPPSSVVLEMSKNGKTATFTATGAAKKKGQAVSLQIATIVTDMTGEVSASSWKQIATGKQDANGKVTITVADPYEVAHSYRAVSGKFTTDEVALSQDDLNDSLGKKNTGLAQVHFNTNEQAKVNTRTKYFEGRFALIAAGSNSAFPECETQVETVSKKGEKSPLVGALKGRGNYSWSFPKKSFTLKLDKKVDLCGMGANKKWALVSNHYDKSLLRNSVAQYVGSKLTNLVFTPESRPVDFWMNGVYQGSYILTERATADPDTRIPYKAVDDQKTIADPADTPGFLLEWDFRKGADVNVQVNKSGWVGIKDPEYDFDKKTGAKKDTGITKAQITYITNYLKDCDKKLYGSNFTDATKGWRSCIDEKSAVDYYIGQELMKPVDGSMWASVYMWKPAGGKLQMGPMWDYDLAAGSANRAGGAVNPTGFYLRNVVKISAKQSTKTWFNRLNEDAGFRSAVKARWKVVSPSLKGSDGFISSQSAKIKSSATENFKKWDIKRKDSSVQIVKGSWQGEVDYLKGWMKSRIAWLDRSF